MRSKKANNDACYGVGVTKDMKRASFIFDVETSSNDVKEWAAEKEARRHTLK